ncbi:MAG: cation:proton antiporter [Gemmatimonadetes bacterium]|nr:cation:proton antiporter [Gemmatimonadota bacterium]
MQHLEPLIGMLGLVGGVILVTALLSGLVERSRFPQVLIFLAIGALLGPYGLGLLELPLDSGALRAIATVGLLLVLFTDAVGVRLEELKRHGRLAAVVLGPGTLVTAAVTALAAYALLGLDPARSAILGAALASTDPVMLRGVLRNRGTPPAARTALRIEGGMNDATLLPVVLVAIAVLVPGGAADAGWWKVGGKVLLLGLAGGVVVALLAAGAVDLVRRRVGVRRDYESLYVLGVSLTAFAGAETVGGSGFIAAFAAGLTIAAVDVELCDCFFDYGEASASMALLFTFVALGVSAIWMGLAVLRPATLAFAAVALFARSLILLATLAPTRLDRRSRLFVVWFGPRGLSSLLLVLLAVFAGVPGSEDLFAVTALVVLLSTVIHGGSQVLLAVAEPPEEATTAPPPPRGAAPAPQTAAPARPGAVPAPGGPPPPAPPVVADRERITLDELAALGRAGTPHYLLDVRTEASWGASAEQAAGALRVPPDDAVRTVTRLGLPYDVWLVLYCT